MNSSLIRSTFKRMSLVLIAGAAGFLGSHLAQVHLDRGDHVVGIDDFSSSSVRSKHLKDLRRNKRFALYETSIMNEEDVNRVATKPDYLLVDRPETYRFSRIYNLACPASPPVYQEKPIHTMMTCVLGTKNLLDLAESNEAVFVQASTSEVYGDPTVSPQHESYLGQVNSYGPRSCYDEGKRAAEALCFDYFNTYQVDARLIRIFNTYGPNMDVGDGRVVSNFIVQALQGKKLTIYGEGKQTRSFCYVDDLIRGMVALGDLPENPRGPINVGNPHEFTIFQLAQRVLYEVYEVKAANIVTPNDLNIERFIERKPLPKDDPTRRCPDIDRAREVLGWEPKISLSDGIRKTIEYFKTVEHNK